MAVEFHGSFRANRTRSGREGDRLSERGPVFAMFTSTMLRTPKTIACPLRHRREEDVVNGALGFQAGGQFYQLEATAPIAHSIGGYLAGQVGRRFGALSSCA